MNTDHWYSAYRKRKPREANKWDGTICGLIIAGLIMCATVAAFMPGGV